MAGQSSMSKGDLIKVLVAVTALLIGGGLIAWNFGAFDGLGSQPPDPNSKFTDAEKKEAERQQKKAKEQEVIAPPSGS